MLGFDFLLQESESLSWIGVLSTTANSGFAVGRLRFLVEPDPCLWNYELHFSGIK
jgi:hypothetical protein